MPLSRRYSPEHPSGDSCVFGFDFSPIIPIGVGIKSGSLKILINTQPPSDGSADWQVGTVTVLDRTLYATLAGGKDGVDYRLDWTALDSDNNIFTRSGLILCAATS